MGRSDGALRGVGSRFLYGVGVVAILCAFCSVALAQGRVGVSGAVNPDAHGTAPGGAARQVEIGQEIVHREQITTDTSGRTQIMFLDGSSMSIGPNSDLTIDEFVYDPSGGAGQLAMSATRGVLRFVGGRLSKDENAVTLRTPSATIGIRGGIFIVNIAADGALDVIFVYGVRLTVTGAGGITQTIQRPGFFVHIHERGAPPSPPARASDKSIGTALALLAGNAPPSGTAPLTSAGLTTTDPQPNLETWTPTNSTPTQSNLDDINTIASQGDPVIANALQSPPAPGSPIPFDWSREVPGPRGGTIVRSGSCAVGVGCSSISSITTANGHAWTTLRSTIPNGLGGFDRSVTLIGPNGMERMR